MSGLRKEDLRIVFMGTPEFAVQSLKAIVEENYNVVGVITAPDKPAGRGRKLLESDVKKYALEKNLRILQPVNLKSEEFIAELSSLRPNLQIVVAFRMLPEQVWAMPEYGTFNLHASLLPQYRGAAPINHVLINSEKESGLTTFFLQHEIDTGNIICQVKVPVHINDNAGILHDRLMINGADLILKTIDKIITGNFKLTDQNTFIDKTTILKSAPKIFKDDCRINWNSDSVSIYNHIRGLSPYPTAWSILKGKTDEWQMKIFSADYEDITSDGVEGSLLTDCKTYIKVITGNGVITLKEIQLSGKKRMGCDEFLRGFRLNSEFYFE